MDDLDLTEGQAIIKRIEDITNKAEQRHLARLKQRAIENDEVRRFAQEDFPAMLEVDRDLILRIIELIDCDND